MAQPVNSYRYEYWTRTSGDLKDRRTPIDVPHIVSTPGDAVKIVVDPTQEYQCGKAPERLLRIPRHRCS